MRKTTTGKELSSWLARRLLNLPAEVNAEVLVEPLIVGLEVFLKSLSRGGVHLLIPAFVAVMCWREHDLPIRQAEEVDDALHVVRRTLEEILALQDEHPVSVEKPVPLSELIHINASGEVGVTPVIPAPVTRIGEDLFLFTLQSLLLGFYGLLEAENLGFLPHPVLVIGERSIYRVPEHCNQLGPRDDLSCSLRSEGMIEIIRAGFSGDDSPPIFPMLPRKMRTIPVDALLEPS